MSNGKGDSPRPLSVTPETYAANYARIQWTETPVDFEGITQITSEEVERADVFAIEWTEVDPRETMRQDNLRHAKHVIDSAPPYIIPCTDAPDAP